MKIKSNESNPIQASTPEIKSNSSESKPFEKADGGVGSIQSRWQEFVSEMSSSGGAVDPNALVQHVLRESYMQTTEDLKFYAEKVKYFNTAKKAIREHLQSLRGYDSEQKKDDILKLTDRLKPGQDNKNVMETLISVFKESIKENNESKKDTLEKLSSMNKLSESLSTQQQVFAAAAQRLAKSEKKDDDD